MVPHSSILAWKIPWTEEPRGLQFMELQRVGHDWAHTRILSSNFLVKDSSSGDFKKRFRMFIVHCLHLFSSVQFGCSVVSNSLWPYEPQYARPPCPSPTPRVHSNPCPLSQWCHPTISSSVFRFAPCPQSFPESGAFPMSQLFAWGGQSTGVSASTSVFPMNTQDWSPLGWTGWTSLESKGLTRVFSKPQFKSINSRALSFLYSPTLTSIHDHWKNHSLD